MDKKQRTIMNQEWMLMIWTRKAAADAAAS